MKNRILTIGMMLCFLVLGTAVSSQADNLRLKNGTIVKGKVVSFSGGSFTVALDLGTSSQSRAIIDMRDVDTIEFDGRGEEKATNTNRDVLPRPSAPDDDTGHRPSSTTPPVSKPLPVQPAPSTSSPSGTLTTANSKEVVAIVPAKDDWTYANVMVRRGDHIHLSASGKVKISASREVGPEGIELEDREKLLRDRPTGGLIAVIGDDNDEFIFIGRDGDFVANRDGKLFLSINEGDLTDNNGSFNVRVKVEPGR